MSSQGEMRSRDRSKLVVWNTRRAQIICVQVVPHLGGVVMTMSSGRKTKPSHRLLSYTNARYFWTSTVRKV
jgi:hypothetical protein